MLFIILFILVSTLSSAHSKSTIAFTTLGRSRYNFDIFTTPFPSNPNSNPNVDHQLTDGVSVNFNGQFLPNSSSLLYVSERHGVPNLYSTSFPFDSPLLENQRSFSFKDRPNFVQKRNSLIYVSTHGNSSSPRQSWAAVYSTEMSSGFTKRLTPYGVSDFSPSVSPSGDWTAVASTGTAGWGGEVQELNTCIYVFKTLDGSRRVKVIAHGGWPAWGDENTLYFHRKSTDGWWSIFRVRFEIDGKDGVELGSVDRITPPGFHAFTPAATIGRTGVVVVATRRKDSDFRHVEIVDVSRGINNVAFVEVTRSISPNKHHYNPFISSDGGLIGYHKCRGGPSLLLENIKTSYSSSFSFFRIDGSFPSFSHDGEYIAYVGLPGLYVVKSDGSENPHQVFDGNVFPTAWDWKRKRVIYTSVGPEFSTEKTEVDIISVDISDQNSKPVIRKLTLNGKNNAFPSPSPDGKWIVFRSGRSGHKNLYIMDSIEGESGEIYQLTEGAWTDTMCNWSPDGEWIAFASDRDDPGNGSFAIYMIHPNGTGLRKVVHSGDGGRTNHPWFSPDSKKLVFTSDYSGVSAEPISNPHHYQPYGEIYTVNIDGSDIQRLTHNSYEDGTPTWTPFYLEPIDVTEYLKGGAQCSFNDCHWLTVNALVNGAQTGTCGAK